MTGEKQKTAVRSEIDAMEPYQLKNVNAAEEEFWEDLRQNALLPDSVAFAHDAALKGYVLFSSLCIKDYLEE